MGRVGGRVFAVEGERPAWTMLYLHGGGYTAGSSLTHRNLIARIAMQAGATTYAPDYSLAPERPHPAALDDAVAAYLWILEQRVEPTSLVVGGDSAGGGLAFALLHALRDRHRPLPAGAFALSPWLDLTLSATSTLAAATPGASVTCEALRGMAAAYASNTSLVDPFVSPIFGELTGLPPLYLQVGGAEILAHDSMHMAERAARCGVDVTLDVVSGEQHVFQIAVGHSVSADSAVERLGKWVKARATAGSGRITHSG